MPATPSVFISDEGGYMNSKKEKKSAFTHSFQLRENNICNFL